MLNQAIQLHQSGRLADAEALYRRVLTGDPRNIDALHMLGILCMQTGRGTQALEWIGRTLALKPDFAAGWCNRGNVLLELGRGEEALAAYDRAIALGLADAGTHTNRGKALGGLQRWDEALKSFDTALALDPHHVGALSDSGVVLMQMGRYAEALESYDRALALAPIATIFSNRANTLQELMRPGEAMASFERALALEPENPSTHWNKALCLLRAGQMGEGLPLYEWRRKRAAWAGPRSLPGPEWTGREPLEGKTLLIHAEQGLGDTIQFCRYAALAKARGAHVILSVQGAMVRLLQSLPVDVCGPDAVPKADFHIQLLSMPLAFGTTLAIIPAETPYLFAEPDRVARWRERIGGEGFRIGVCWQGETLGDTGRHFMPETLAPLGRLPGVRLISLQKGSPPAAGIESLGADFDAGPDAFLDSAAVMQGLDLVITVDTAIAHLAGALGRPTWVGLRHLPDWRWLMARDDSPWYPGMRLLRQPAAGDWTSVIAQMQTLLQARL